MRSGLTVILALLITYAGVSFAHNGAICGRPLPSNAKALFPDMPKRPFDVLKYQLTLDWRKIFETRSQQYSGVNLITVQVTDSTPNITLDAGLMKIDGITINGTPVHPVPQPSADEKLIIPLPQSFQAAGKAPLSISIGYHKDTLLNLGIYFYPKGTMNPYGSDTTTEDLAYTMSEPLDAHYWMPCMDLPYDKAQSEISIIVPNGIETASNGMLVSKQPYSVNATVWNWKSDEPIATYLMVADASNYIHWGETHERSSAPGDTVHLDYYAWPSDYYQDSIKDGSEFNATYAFRNVSSIMSNFESHYGGFPFVKYGQAPIMPFTYGGMEHQTMTSIHRFWLRGDQGQQGIAHEMSHQWFGDKTTCETFKDIWLNEGFATFSEAIWGEGQGGTIEYTGIIDTKARDYFGGPVHDLPIYDPPANNIFNGALSYAKGACVLHMLRRMLGNDTMFFGALRDYSNAFAYATANTTQFQNFMSGRLGIDLTEFFGQWIFGRLHPHYSIGWAQNAGNHFFIRINQIQDVSVRDHFTMPVKFFAYHGGVRDTLTFFNNTRSQSFQKAVPYTIDSLLFDQDALLLSVDTIYYAPQLGVRSKNDSHLQFEVYRDGGTLLCKFIRAGQDATIELYNSLGMRMRIAGVSPGEEFKKLDIGNLSSGIYFVRYSCGAMNEIRSVNITR